MNYSLWAWMRPISVCDTQVTWLDHTYVTTYIPLDQYPTIEDVIAAGEGFWYCCGVLDYTGSQLVPQCPETGVWGNSQLVNCIATPNDPNSNGSITIYGLYGVCHQAANQVLFSTPNLVTVLGAKGWRLSFFLYGIFGTSYSGWNNLKIKCVFGQTMPTDNSYAGQVVALHLAAPSETSDADMRAQEVDVHVNQCLGQSLDDDTMTFLKEMKEDALQQRTALAEQLQAGTLTSNDFAQQINNIHNTMLDKIAARVTADDFEKLFGCTPDNKIHMVDPASVAAPK